MKAEAEIVAVQFEKWKNGGEGFFELFLCMASLQGKSNNHK